MCNSIGEILSAKLATARRQGPRNRLHRAKRPARRSAPQADPAVADAVLEEALRRSPVARNALETSESLTLAKLTAALTAWGAKDAENALRRVSRQLADAESQFTPDAIARAHAHRCRLPDVEAEAREWRRKLAAAEAERMRLEFELAGWTRGR